MILLLFIYLLSVASISSSPLIFSTDFLKEPQHKLSVLAHSEYTKGEEDLEPGQTPPHNNNKLRFLYLVPKYGRLSELNEGFSSKLFGEGHIPKHHSFLNFDHEVESLVELLGVSDCATWHAVLMGVWGPGGYKHKAFAHVKNNGKFKSYDLEQHFNSMGVLSLPLVHKLAGFVKDRVETEVLKGLLKKGLPSHAFTHNLNTELKRTL